MKLFTVLALVLAGLALPLDSRAVVIVDCPSDGWDVYCTAYADNFYINTRTPAPLMNGCSIFVDPGIVGRNGYFGMMGEIGSPTCGAKFEEYLGKVRAALALGVPVYPIASNDYYGGGIQISWDYVTYIVNAEVSLKPKPNWCLLDNSLEFDYGTLPAGLVNKTLSGTLTVTCTMRADGILTLNGGSGENGANLSLGSSGLVATITANGSPLATRIIALPKGRTPISIESKLVGNTVGSGDFSASGVLQLDYFY